MPGHTPDPESDRRRRDVAKLLAAGLLRFNRRVQGATSSVPESTQNCLDVSPQTSLNGATGPAVNAAGDPESEGTYVQD
jgi:hypothetical protein